MSERVATTPGLYPQPDRAKAELTDLKGHQRADLIDGSEGEAVEEAYDRARATVVADQDDAGLDRVVEGQLRWDDLLAHPLAVSDAVETGGIVRYYDNNNFYRDPTIVDGLRPTGDVARELETAAALTEAPLQAVLPGPVRARRPRDRRALRRRGGAPRRASRSFSRARSRSFPPTRRCSCSTPRS
jgi:Methionine synthase II (cobalamin-independent)